MKVRVNEAHIKYGARGKTDHCAIALALRDLVRDDVLVSVTDRNVVFSILDPAGYDVIVANSQRSCLLPFSAQDFVQNFDHNEHVEPIEFDLDVPEHLLRSWIQHGLETARRIAQEAQMCQMVDALPTPELVGA